MTVRFISAMLIASLICGVAAVFGTAVIDTRALVVLPGLLVAGAIAFGVLTLKNPLPVIGMTALILLPIVGIIVPPARFDISLFDVLGILAGVSLLASRHKPVEHDLLRRPPLWVLLPIIAVVPTALFAIDRIHSGIVCIEIFTAYFLLAAILRVGTDAEKSLGMITRWICISVIIISAAVTFDHFTQINLSFTGGYNLNAFAEAGIYRAGGFFQDPQKAAQFLGCFMTYLVVLASRRSASAEVPRSLMWSAIVSAFVGLLFTVSRSGLLSGMAFSLLGFVFVNRFGLALRSGLIALLLVVGWMVFSTPDVVQSMLPDTVAHRLNNVDKGADGRYGIWEDSWHLFVNNPVFGIGPGNYREAEMRERPSLRGLYELGLYVPDQPENGYLKILYETGSVGAIAFLVFAVGLLRRCMKGTTTNELQSYKLAALFGMLAFAFSFVTLFTVSDHRNLMIVVIMIAVIHLATLQTAEARK